MRSLWASLAFGLLGLGVMACGGTSKGAVSVSQPSSAAVVSSDTVAARTIPHLTPGERYLNDGDKDPSSDEDHDNLNGKKIDEDNDPREDYVPTQNHSYHDSDENDIVRFGRPAGIADKRAVITVVKHYQEAALTGDAAKACSLLYSTFAETVPEDYGQAPGPAYLRGGTTCQAVMSMLFKHFHSELTSTFDVTGVRVMGNRGITLLGSRTRPASHIDVRRERGVWKVDALLAVPLP